MLNNLITKLVLWALHSKKIVGENKTKITNALLENIGTLPTKRLITFDQYGTMLVNGKYLEVETAIRFKQSAMALRDNEVKRIMNDQLKALAIEMGVHNGLNPETIMFSKAFLYSIQEEDKLISQIIGE